MLSKKAKYALNASIYLAKRYESGPILITEIARQEGIPQKFLEAILLELRNRGLLQSKKGKGGGYSLAKKPDQIFLGEILRIIDGPLAPVPCVSQTAYRKCDDCLEERCCGLRIVMKDVRDATARILDSTSLTDVIVKVNQLTEKDAFNYHI